MIWMAVGCFFVILLSVFLFFRTDKKEPVAPPQIKPLTISSHDIRAIAGEDVIATQLDLARAYIETGRKQLAKKILHYVAEQGSSMQQAEAKRLLEFL